MRPADQVKPWFVKGINESSVILKPGETAYCNKDFQLQNTSRELAQVQVVMGNGATYYWTRLDPLASKSYSLDSISGYSSPRASGVDVDEARIVNSHYG